MAGVRHGAYALHVVDGPLVAEGRYVHGKKEGVFVFYTTGGTRVAEIPYAADRMHGTVQLWYSEFAFPDAAGRLKLRARYTDGAVDGTKETWWPSGAPRTHEEFAAGERVRASAWSEAGVPLTEAQAAERSGQGVRADANYYAVLESELQRHPPPCARAAE